MTATRLDLVRHGHVANTQRRVYGHQPGWKLSPEGRRQAAEAAEHLEGRPIVHLYSSPLERATETAAAIASACGAPVTEDDGLIESALRAIAGRHPGQEVVVVSHGDPIKAAVCHLAGTPIAEMHALRIPTGGLVSIEMGSGAVRILERWEPARMVKR